MNWQKLRYAVSGLLRRPRQKRTCPSCGSASYQRIDRKGFHELLRCGRCFLLYRWPYETQEEMAHFYQRTYKQAGLTTELPGPAALSDLIATGFRASEKDFSHIVDLLETLSVSRGSRVLDFGANWGYGVWQLCQVGFSAIGYELSEPRAAYSTKLGVQVFTDWSEIQRRAPFDVVFSSHVLEHTPNPAQTLSRQLEVLSPNGWLIGSFPNGSDAFRKANPTAFRRLWGQVHPVMLNEDFIRHALPGSSTATGAYCREDLQALKCWNRTTPWTGTLNTGEMLFIWTHPTLNSEHRADS